jgi:glycine hydroxymethyltransferase
MGSDHGGFRMKETVGGILRAGGALVEDVGCHGIESVDYPDYARLVADRVLAGAADTGVLICTTGVGMSIAANKIDGIRAALCCTPEMARMARGHNNANVLVLGGGMAGNDVLAIVNAWLKTGFAGEERHVRRLAKIAAAGVYDADAEVFGAIRAEEERQQTTLNFIASENHVSRAVRAAQGSVLTNKYAEGYPSKRWYNGCQYVDVVEALAINRAKALFGAGHANVQPHCGSSANMAVYFSILKPGDTILAMSLTHGGHLTHGSDVNFSGRFFKVHFYGVNRETGLIDYEDVARLAAFHRPKLIVAGASAYPRTLDFALFRKAADEVGAMLMVDIAHIAGLVAGGAHPSPVPFSEFVTTTTHKTLRGPRGGMILCREEFGREVDRQVFPGIQGGPLMHTIASKAVCLHEAAQPAFREHAAGIVRNAAHLAGCLRDLGFRLVSGGTDNHLMLVDLSATPLTGRDAAAALDRAGIIVNKNAIPFDTRSPVLTSGIRIGTPSVTTRGMRAPEMEQVAKWIERVLARPDDEAVAARVRAEVRELAAAFPAP